MTRSEIKEILVGEMENKRQYDSRFNCDCDLCGDPINRGDVLYFVSEKRKMCQNCYNEVIDYLEGLSL